MARLKEAHPTAKVELRCEDEHRLGLKPIIRKVRSPVGERPIVKVHQRYEWTHLYAFARPPKTGEDRLADPPQGERGGLLVGPGALRQGGRGAHQEARPAGARRGRMAHGQEEEAEGARRDTPGVLAVSLPGAYAGRKAVAPERRRGGEPLLYEKIEELEETLVERCVALGNQPEVIRRSHLRYRWWPEAA